ncbi:MAG: glycoside hydrolase family 3 N-terminal domain-containing protein [Candidatus Marinimicrobia bacterium]|nr:glycoside hydrolase family 3 N-terminal domain-containing protein [Candidatus Neomarinimicrobiota bacterium]
MTSIKTKKLTHLLRLSISLLLFFLSPIYALDSLSFKIGQMIMVGFYPSSNFEDTLYYDIEHRNLGGVILMGYNLDDPTQIAELTNSLQVPADTPLLIATDQEGGVVARLDETNGYARTDRALALGNINSEDTTRAQASLMAGWLSQAGINTNLAPVADVNVNPSSPAIGYYGRSFSADPYVVANHCRWFYSEFKDRDIISTLKHFPGHGSAEGDSHDGFTDITNTWSESELIPYTEMINSGYNDMIMTGHLYNAQLDSIYPATLSQPTLTGLLRDSLGFQGVIISDAMGMRAISNNYSFIESVVQAIHAGVDILLYTGNEKYDRSVVGLIIDVLGSAVDSGLISEARIDESYDRIMALKTETNTAIAPSQPLIADTFELRAYPNPFNSSTKISFHIDQDLHETIEISIYSIAGQLIQRNFVAVNGAGDYDILWNGTSMNGTSLPSGTYIYVLKIGNRMLSGKMTLLK